MWNAFNVQQVVEAQQSMRDIMDANFQNINRYTPVAPLFLFLVLCVAPSPFLHYLTFDSSYCQVRAGTHALSCFSPRFQRQRTRTHFISLPSLCRCLDSIHARAHNAQPHFLIFACGQTHAQTFIFEMRNYTENTRLHTHKNQCAGVWMRCNATSTRGPGPERAQATPSS